MGITYQQAVNIVKMRLHILWRTSDLIQDVDKNCGHVDNSCGYLVCKLFVNIKKKVVDCEYLNCHGWQIKRKILKTGN
jgi:hypothetical protein